MPDITLPQRDHKNRAPAQMRHPDIVFESVYDPAGSKRGIPFNQLPQSLQDLEKIQRIRNPNEIVYVTGPGDDNLVLDMWLTWPGYCDQRATSWPVNRASPVATGITRKDFLIAIHGFLDKAMDRFEKRGDTVGFSYPVGPQNGHIWKHHVVVTKVYHTHGQEWQVEIRLRGWPKKEEEEDVKVGIVEREY
ncbi:hypothetical protein CVT24_012756 [Panaeolus cyanescens]|uniref:Uncharacterized protein n=1 Tax=Panaeolus cyanescens TaxID=181874 RepID=A0A409YJN4_9AGAR|nr:hypothetical protein CVT24_012756 [Panaeolus cyanescens]